MVKGKNKGKAKGKPVASTAPAGLPWGKYVSSNSILFNSIANAKPNSKAPVVTALPHRPNSHLGQLHAIIGAHVGKHYTLALAAWVAYATSKGVKGNLRQWFYHGLQLNHAKHNGGGVYGIGANGNVFATGGMAYNAPIAFAVGSTSGYTLLNPTGLTTQAPQAKPKPKPKAKGKGKVVTPTTTPTATPTTTPTATPTTTPKPVTKTA